MNAVTLDGGTVRSDGGTGGHLANIGAITLDDILYFLMAKTTVSSGFGAALERARVGLSGRPKKGSGQASCVAASESASQETLLLKAASISRCVTVLAGVEKVDFEPCPDLRRFATQAKMNEGEVAIGVLRAYQERCTQSEERALAEACIWLIKHVPGFEITLKSEDDLAQDFRQGRQKRARGKSLCVLADARLVLAKWVVLWNRQRMRAAA
jgi:hypothetical protein